MDQPLLNLLDDLNAMRTFARLVCRDQQAADKLLETTMTEAIRLAGAGQDQANRFDWLMRLICRLSRERQPPPEAAQAADAGQDPLIQALRQLPWQDREAVILTDVLGMDIASAADITGCTPAMLMSLRQRGRLALGKVWRE